MNLIEKLRIYGFNRDKATALCFDWFMRLEMAGDTVFVIPESEPCGFSIPRDDPLLREDLQKLENLAGLILHIRSLAANYGLAGEYNWGLLFYSFAALKFSNLNDVPWAPLPWAPLPRPWRT